MYIFLYQNSTVLFILISDLRIPYLADDIKKDFSEKDPLTLFDVWFAVAQNTDGIREANAMALATADK